MTFKRELFHKLKKDLFKGRSTLLLGPRQTGKTTLIKELCENFPIRLEYDLRLPSLKLKLENDPETIIREVRALKSSSKPLVFIDEIQKVPNVMDVLQYLLDNKMIVLIATGSSVIKLRRGTTNWLPCRIKLEYLYPLTWQEIELIDNSKEDGLFKEHLLFGGLPGIMAEKNLKNRKEDLLAYTSLYLEEEIRQEALVRRLPTFSKFLKLAALESGSSPNLSKMANEVGVSHTSIREYYQILEDSLIVNRIDSFGKSRSQILKKSRFYFFDLGVRNSVAEVSHGKAVLTLQSGLLFEHNIVLELIAKNCGHYKLSYWRTKQGNEVDIILEYKEKVIALEIKNTAKPQHEDFKGLKAFSEAVDCSKRYLICNIDRPQKYPHGMALPWHQLDLIFK
ncbi:MAG: ATP-binding protein [Elusimicrobiota bacterium]|nr:ATP-binding protein [Elusimicrobiota bacterium]